MGRPGLLARTLPAAATAAASVVVACTPAPEGPAAPIAAEHVAVGRAFDASASRQAVLDFVAAYAASPAEGIGALLGVVGGAELASWVRWLDVQHREFPGAVDASAEVRDVEFVGEVQSGDLIGAQVALSASVVFRFAPEGDEIFDRVRILDGPVSVAQTQDRRFVVVDLLRDGVSMSDGIEIFDALGGREGPLEVSVDSLHMFPPNWQFNVVIRNRSPRPWPLRPELSGLYIRADGEAFQREAGTATGSLETIPPGGQVDGILAYPMQDSAQGRVLTIAFGRAHDPLLFNFPLDGLVSVVPPPPPAAPGEAAGASS